MRKLRHHSVFLSVYSGVVTAVLLLIMLVGMTKPSRTSFEEIDVQRINIVEPDGTMRLVLSSKAKFPGIIFRGKEYPHPTRKTAGMLFFNDEGTENGGLIFGGQKDATGKVDAFGHLSFDQYDQDQVITFSSADNESYHKAGVSVWDRPEWSTEDLVKVIAKSSSLSKDAQRTEIDKFFSGRASAHPRLYLGKTDSGAVSLRMNDAEGHERLIVEVTANGTAALRFLDRHGKEVARFPAPVKP